MTIKLEWRQDLEEEGWPRRDAEPPDQRRAQLPRWLFPVVLALTAGLFAAIWQRSSANLKAVRADVQEAVSFGQWGLEQGLEELFRQHLDPLDPAWQAYVLVGWDQLLAEAQQGTAPQVTQVSLLSDLAEASLRWTDATSGTSYRVKRWFRLVQGEWRWARPPDPPNGRTATTAGTHVTLTHKLEEGPLAESMLALLDPLATDLCRQYDVTGDSCAFFLDWTLTGEDGLPASYHDLDLPPLAAVSDDLDADLYLMGVDRSIWNRQIVRQDLQRFFPGGSSLQRLQPRMIRPGGLQRLPAALIGTETLPASLPNPQLVGVGDDGTPHPRWQALAERLLTDLVLRRAHGPILGSRGHVNAAWALHQALLAWATEMPGLHQLPPPGPATGQMGPTLQMPDLGTLGAALQEGPSPLALDQLADLTQFLQSTFDDDQLVALARSLGRHGSTNRLLAETLGTDEATFLTLWRAGQLARADSPLAGLAAELKNHIWLEAQARGSQTRDQVGELFTPAGRQWLFSIHVDQVLGEAPNRQDWDALILAMGAIEDRVWVELEERGAEQARVELRFYTWDPLQGWLRDAPDPRFWGQQRTLNTGQINWQFQELDAETVWAIADDIEGFLRQIRNDLGLPLQPLTAIVVPDSNYTGNFDGVGLLRVPSPYNWLLSGGQLKARESLRTLIGRLLAERIAWRQRHLAPALELEDVDLVTIQSAIAYVELQSWAIPSGESYAQWIDPLNAAVRSGALAHLDQERPASLSNAEQFALILYLSQVSGGPWLGRVLADGLREALSQVRQAHGWDSDQLQADWQRFLEGHFGQPSSIGHIGYPLL